MFGHDVLETLIDQQARNRDNLLSVWVHHPFPALVKVPTIPSFVAEHPETYGSIIELIFTPGVRGGFAFFHSRARVELAPEAFDMEQVFCNKTSAAGFPH